VTVYTSAFLCAGGAALAFIAPVAFQRLHFRRAARKAWCCSRTACHCWAWSC
jgi:hypothetical protein